MSGSVFRHAVRSLRSSPGFTLTAIGIIMLGVGAATAIFTVMDFVLFRPLPYPEPDRLIAICETNPSIEGFCIASPPDVSDWAASSKTLTEIGFARTWQFVIRSDEGAVGVGGGYATPGWYRALGVRPSIGRLFTDGDVAPGAERVALLTDALWAERFGRDAAVIGKTLMLAGEPHTVVGVLPADFVAPDLERVRLWTPPPWDPRDEELRGWRGFQVVARMAPGVSMAQASAELSAIQENLARAHPETNEGWGVRTRSLHDRITGAARPVLAVFAAGVLCLLLIGCANLANLMLVRATRRHRELALRLAIGAGRRHIFTQLLVESLVIAGVGSFAGLLVAAWAVPLITSLAPAGIPRLDDAHVNPAAFAFALIASLATAILFGLAPAIRASVTDPVDGFRGGQSAGESRGTGRVRRVLVAAELALTLVLLIGAGLLTRSLAGLVSWSPGFPVDGLTAFSAFASTDTYADAASVAIGWKRVEDEIAATPGVASVGMVSAGPVFGGIEPGRFEIVGRPAPAEVPTVRWYDASPGYFRTLGLPILRGRDMEETDVRGSMPVALINETFAHQWFEGLDPIGQRVHLTDFDQEVEIVGVVADIPPFDAGEARGPEIWWSNRQQPRWGTYFVVRTTGDAAGVLREVRRRIGAIDPDLQIGGMTSYHDLIDTRLVSPRFNLALVATLAVLALILAVAGLYGVLAWAVSMRHREIAIRMALGARQFDVLLRILGEAAITAGAGLGAGIVASFVIVRYAASLLHGVPARDPVTFGMTLLLLALVALLASLVPALRATRVQPARALRQP